MNDQQGLTPQDTAALKAVAGFSFTKDGVKLPSGIMLTFAEVQALSSAYAPPADTPAPGPGQPEQTEHHRDGRPVLEHRNDEPWHLAKIPWRWHRCRPQTTATTAEGELLWQRCACGAERKPRTGWTDRNKRRGAGWDVTRGWDSR